MRKVLVTGGAGFIGSHVVERFLAAGDSVMVLDDLSTGRSSNLPATVDCRVLTIQSPAARDLIREGDFHVIVHLAAQIDVRVSVSDPIRDAETNVLGSLNVLEAVRALPEGRRPRVVFSSTGGALYGDAAEFPTTESSPANPDAPYGVAKLAVEFYLAYYARVWNIETVVLRFGNVYGPRQDPHGEAGVIAIFAHRLLSGEQPTVFGTGEQTRDYIYVSDVADALYVAATRPLPAAGALDARAFNIGTEVETSVVDLARMMAKAAGVALSIKFAPHRPGEVVRSLLATRKAAMGLGWKSTVSIEDGLARTIQWARANQPHLGEGKIPPPKR